MSISAVNGSEEKAIPVVGIGASAGGIEAFKAFFENMPVESGMAFVVILHLPPDRISLLPEILSRWTKMRIVQVQEGCLVEANCVYLPPSGTPVTLRENHLHLQKRAAKEPHELMPIDLFFNSLAIALNDAAIGVILSGTGSDGALGLKAIKTRGGLTLAQGADGTAPMYDGMPTNAIAIASVDIVTSVENIPRYILNAHAARTASDDSTALSPEQLNAARLAICAAIQRQIGHDFSHYKEKTFMRRVDRRIQVLGIKTITAYVARLEHDREEAVMLFRDLLIGVTSFFRDAETFEALKSLVIPRLFLKSNAGWTIRVWVAGCATGEEAYSLAILLQEHIDTLGGTPPIVQIFATDIDDPRIATARAGRYPSTLVQDISPERLARFFVAGNDGSYTVAKEIRALCTFSVHSLTRDPPFSRIDFISCRNLLIYLDADLQSIVVPAFHYALAREGLLLLGSSENISRHETLFKSLDRTHKIFERRDAPPIPLQLMGKPILQQTATETQPGTSVSRTGMIKMNNRASARILERYAPAFVVVDPAGDVVQYSSRTSRFLEPAPGLPSRNILTMVRRGMYVPLSAALKEAVGTGRLVEKMNVSVAGADEQIQRISLIVEPISERGSAMHYLVVFIDGSRQTEIGEDLSALEDHVASHEDRRFEAELRDTQEQLQSITEQHETALEELRSANEELHSVNEELQSTNEELETSKEEIQSINEELQTVNAQLAGKVDELDNKNTDLQNLFESTQVATIFVDSNFVIRGFTPAVTNIYNLIPSDHGRPLTHIVSRLQYTGLRADLQRVLKTLEPLERRIVLEDGSTHYLMRILPYRAPDSSVDGAVITFVDVTSIVLAEQHHRLLVDELNHRVKNMLTVVISLASQTLQRSKTLEEFSTNYLGRVHALASAYALLSNENWQPISLQTLVMEELAPFLLGDKSNITVLGPAVALEPRSALALSMAIHELTTNAVKYGALSVPEGKVTVTWQTEWQSDGEKLMLNWIERGGPEVIAPPSRGFGLMLIERGLKQDMSAITEMEFMAEGVTARVIAPLKIAGSPQPDLAPES